MPWDKARAESVLREIRETVPGPVQLMEVCGTHTMSIAKSGLRWIAAELQQCRRIPSGSIPVRVQKRLYWASV